PLEGWGATAGRPLRSAPYGGPSPASWTWPPESPPATGRSRPCRAPSRANTARRIREGRPHMRVSLFVTCLADQLWPSAGVGAVEVLRRVGCAVEFDERQTCCGQPAFNTGYRPEACSLARRLIEIFESSGADAIVSPSGSCTAMLHHYEQLFEDAGWRARARAVRQRPHGRGACP